MVIPIQTTTIRELRKLSFPQSQQGELQCQIGFFIQVDTSKIAATTLPTSWPALGSQ
jgi:hypothetical protein